MTSELPLPDWYLPAFRRNAQELRHPDVVATKEDLAEAAGTIETLCDRIEQMQEKLRTETVIAATYQKVYFQDARKWEHEHYRATVAEVERDQLNALAVQLVGERDRAFALMGEMDRLISRGREAERIVRDLTDKSPLAMTESEDYYCVLCEAESGWSDRVEHDISCLWERARTWMKENSE